MKYSKHTESVKRLVRSAYYDEHGVPLTDKEGDMLPEHELEEYYSTGLKAQRIDKIKEFFQAVFGIAIFIAFWVAIIAIGAYSSDSGDTSQSSVTPLTSSVDEESSSSDTSSDYDLGSADADDADTGDDESECNENYSPCVDNSSYDLDCADIGEEVEVVGYDEYRLDRDGDGWGCESY